MTHEPPPYPGDDANTHGLPAYGSVPPPPGGHPPAPGGYGPPPGAFPYSATGAVAYGWTKLKQNAVAMIVATLLLILGGLALAVVSRMVAPPPDYVTPDGRFEFDGSAVAASLVAQIITGTIGYVLSAMLVRGALDVTRGESFSIGRAFSRLPVVKVLVTGLMLSVLTTIGIALCFLPGIIFAIFSFFTIYFVLDTDASPFAALGSSFSLVGSHFGDGLLTGLLCFLVLLAGTVLCLVGLLGAIPIVTLAGAYAYRAFQGQPVAA